jgi:CP family cyanate transporter-like MFS transporter
MQIAFLTHHVALIAGSLGETGAAATVSATGLAALAGRVLFSRYADRAELRLITAALLVIGAGMFAALALTAMPTAIILASVIYGTTLGNITALSPIIVRREFGATIFGPVYGAAAAAIGVVAAFGPATWGFLHDLSGGYAAPLLVAAALDIVAAIAITSNKLRVR